MLTLFALLPWVLTVGALFFIIVRNRMTEDSEDFEDDFITDENTVIIKAAVYEDKAYWVHENVFYESEITREPDWETARPIDTSTLSAKELNKLLTILDDLNSEKG